MVQMSLEVKIIKKLCATYTLPLVLLELCYACYKYHKFSGTCTLGGPFAVTVGVWRRMKISTLVGLLIFS